MENHIRSLEVCFENITKIDTTTYRVIGWKGPKVIAYCSKNMGSIALLSPPGAHQIWSIW